MFAIPEREPGQTDVIELKCEPIDNVRIAIIGLGMRGSGAVRRLSYIEGGATITVLCDVVPKNVEHSQNILREMEKPELWYIPGRMTGRRFVNTKMLIWFMCAHIGICIRLLQFWRWKMVNM